MSDLLRQTVAFAEEYQNTINEQSVFPTQVELERLADFQEPLPTGPTSPEDVMAMLHQVGAPASVKSTGGRYFGFVIGGGLPATVATNWLATVWDQVASSHTTSPVAAAVEQVALNWLLDIFNFPREHAGALVTGATMAHFTALTAARYALLQRQGWDVIEKGLFGAPPVDVIVGAESHPTVLKVLEFLGFGKESWIQAPVDNKGRVIANQVPKTQNPTLLCLQAGNVNTGEFDPIGEICSQFQTPDTWVHVDGAFGLWAATSERYAHLTEGMQLADSWSTDGHKWLNVPYDSGIAIVADKKALEAVMTIRAPYLPVSETREPEDYTPEFSRRARGLEIWAALKSLGRTGVADLIERTCGYAKQFAHGLNEAGYQILNDVVLNQVLVSFGAPGKTLKVIKAIQEEGTCWAGSTQWQGHTAMRISVSSWATTEEDVKKSLETMIRVAKTIA